MLITVSRTLRRLGGHLVTVAGAAAVLFALVILVPGALGFERYVITGGSMSGSIERGDLIFAEARPVAELAVGDVITYVPPAETGMTELVTHRIIDVSYTSEGPLFRTQGDANATADPWQFRLDAPLQAVHVATVPLVGWVFIALADPLNRMIMLGIPAAIIGVMALLEIIRLARPASRRAGSLAGDWGRPTAEGYALGDVIVDRP